MSVELAYNKWAEIYDTNQNKTRDLEGISFICTLEKIKFTSCLEIGCGTGKNTKWLITKADKIIAVDLSSEMLNKAKEKIQSENVEFVQANINDDWSFTQKNQFDCVSFSLVLEHIENLDAIFEKLNKVVLKNGIVYIGELHPYKQYSGTKARFETEDGLKIVTCFNHNISDFTNAAKKFGFEIELIEEYFDNNDRSNIPRILTIILRKKF